MKQKLRSVSDAQEIMKNLQAPANASVSSSDAGHAERTDAIHRKNVLQMLGMLMLLCLLVFHDFIFGISVYLFKDIGSDTLNVYYPSYLNVAETLRQGHLPSWSFEQGLGQNVFPFSLSDPSDYILYLLGGGALPYGLAWVEIIKIVCSGLLFFMFLKKLGVETAAAYIGGLLYAFSGYMIVGGSWYIFSTLGLYTALILLAFEMLYSENKWWLFPIGVSLIAAYNFVSLYTSSVFLLVYLMFRVFGEDDFQPRQIPTLLLRLMLLGALGVLISAVFSIPNLMQMIESPRVSGNASLANSLAADPVFRMGDGNYLATLLMRTFSNDLLGNGSNFKGWRNYLESPMAYCGLLTLLLVPQIFCFLKTRKRIVFGALVGLFIFAELFPWFRKAFWLFQGDYFRDFSLYVSIIFILFSALALDKIFRGRKIDLRVLGISLFMLLLLLYFPYDLDLRGFFGTTKFSAAMDHRIQNLVASILVLFAAILTMCSSGKFRKYAPICLLFMVCIELAGFNYYTVNHRDVMNAAELYEKSGYNDYSVEAISFIKQQDRDFFRIEKNYSSSPAMLAGFNDSKVQHYFGSSAYNSFNQLNYINFLAACGVLNPNIKTETMWSVGLRNKPLLQILTGVRYFLFKGDWISKPAFNNFYTQIGNFGDVAVLKSKYALPMGVAYDTYILQSDFARLDSIARQIALLKAIMVPDGLAGEVATLSRITGKDISVNTYSPDEIALDTAKLKSDGFHIGSFSNDAINGNINSGTRQLIFFSIPFDKGWKATVNGNEAVVYMVDGGLSAVMVQPGNNVISLHYSPPYVEMGSYISLFALFMFGVAWFSRPQRASGLR